MRPNVYSKADAVGRQQVTNDGLLELCSRAKCSWINPSKVEEKFGSGLKK